MSSAQDTPPRVSAREKLLEAAVTVIRQKGYTATTVDDLCREAGVTKGAFFHHFASKEDLGVAAAEFWGETTGALFATAPYHAPADPLDRLLAYLDFRTALLDGEVPDVTCLVGTMAQEVYRASPDITRACEASIAGHAETLIEDIETARQLYGLTDTEWSARSLALHTQAVLQGAFILAKASGTTAHAKDSIAHLRRYILFLFSAADSEKARP